MAEKANDKNIGGEVVDLSEINLSNKIYNIRGVQVMLDVDLAEIYGYTTKAFNQQVRRNTEKFEGDDFMFQLTRDELAELVRSHFVTSREMKYFRGQEGGARYLPYAFTEQGIYMLMTVLKGELATRQSRALVMMFKMLKDYIVETQQITSYKENLQIMAQVAENTKEIGKLKTDFRGVESEIKRLNDRAKNIEKEMNNAVKKSDISPVMLDFCKIIETKEFLIMNGEPARATETFMDVYSKAKKKIYIIDNYISIKTLMLLRMINKKVEVTIFTDNINNGLSRNDYENFKKEYPEIRINFIKTGGVMHDRFIVIDDEIFYQCGSSSKDAGRKITIISRITSKPIEKGLLEFVEKLSKIKLELR